MNTSQVIRSFFFDFTRIYVMLLFLCYFVLTRPLLLCYPVLRLPCLPHHIKFLNSKFTYMILLHYLCGYGKYEPWGRREAR